jgi:hypothetical protein
MMFPEEGRDVRTTLALPVDNKFRVGIAASGLSDIAL